MTIDSVLIANRGEIAARIARACRSLGLRTVAVYSNADRDAPHLALADAAVWIGGAPAAESYLDIDAIVAAARCAGADAVHPGYGFLAENPRLAAACAEAGLAFVGPTPEVIARMGSKIAAKAAAEQAGVAVVPGYHGSQDDAELAAEATRIGFPLMIKASAGGGGRGMRRVDDAAGFAAALAMARGEARAAFGDDAVLLERFVARGRHVEVQMLADHHGNVVHLFDRDCSIQRGNQKLVEEAPAPNLPAATRQAMLDRAVALARHIGYRNAGTVEFIYDADADRAWFLEMNTRLQVEHPVTEMVTGIDLVAWQIRIAGGEPLGFGQDAVRCTGHAIEARIAAEDPAAGYRPQTGTVVGYDEPGGDGIRVDSGIAAGSAVTPHYDSMLAKVIAHGPNRETARRRLRAALAGLRVDGLRTNRVFLADIVDLTPFRCARHTTALLKDAYPEGWTAPATTGRALGEAALAYCLARRNGADSALPWQSLGAWRVTEPAGRPGVSHLLLAVDAGAAEEITVTGRGGSRRAERAGRVLVDATDPVWRDGILTYREAGRRRRVALTIDGDRVLLASGDTVAVLVPGRTMTSDRDSASGDGRIRAPMPGRLAELRVAVGDIVTAGQTVAVLEAMKLFQELKAPAGGTVTAVHRRACEPVDGQAILVEVTP